jgi:hypothetical protein
MEKLLAVLMAAMLVSFLSAGRSWSSDKLPYRLISEEAVRTASARLYADILRQECLHGRRYPLSQIKSGFKRHFEEMRLTYIDEGYTIVPNVTENNGLWTLSHMEFDARRRNGIARQFGCSRPYWLEDS